MTEILKFLLIFSLSFVIFKVTFQNRYEPSEDISKLKDENNELKKMIKDQINYIDWYKCMDSSKTDKECFICDSLYNPNQDFIY